MEHPNVARYPAEYLKKRVSVNFSTKKILPIEPNLPFGIICSYFNADENYQRKSGSRLTFESNDRSCLFPSPKTCFEINNF